MRDIPPDRQLTKGVNSKLLFIKARLKNGAAAEAEGLMLRAVVDDLPHRLERLGELFTGRSADVSEVLHRVYELLEVLGVHRWEPGACDEGPPDERDCPQSAFRQALWEAAVRLREKVNPVLGPAQRRRLDARHFGVYCQQRFARLPPLPSEGGCSEPPAAPTGASAPRRASRRASGVLRPGTLWLVERPAATPVVAVISRGSVAWRGYGATTDLLRTADGAVGMLGCWVLAARPEWVAWDDNTAWTPCSGEKEQGAAAPDAEQQQQQQQQHEIPAEAAAVAAASVQRPPSSPGSQEPLSPPPSDPCSPALARNSAASWSGGGTPPPAASPPGWGAAGECAQERGGSCGPPARRGSRGPAQPHKGDQERAQHGSTDQRNSPFGAVECP